MSDFKSYSIPTNQIIPPWNRHVFISDEEVRFSPRSAEDVFQSFKYSGIKAYFFRLKTPIAVEGELSGTVVYKGVRIHPPFPVEEGETDIGVFRGVELPNSGSSVNEVPAGLTKRPTTKFAPNATMCSGLRVDVPAGISTWPQLDYILGLIRERTHQWWITTDRNPFDLGLRFRADLGANDELLPYEADGSRENKVPWGFAHALQLRVTFETPLNQAEWLQCVHAASQEQRHETATAFFHDALSSYFANRDEACLYQMCVSLEIMESKVRQLAGNPTKDFALRLLRGAKLWRNEDRDVLTKMFSDRGKVAHGRAPVHMTRDPQMIIQYIRIGEKYYRLFMEHVKGMGWHRIAMM
jgi:hypothetical protein